MLRWTGDRLLVEARLRRLSANDGVVGRARTCELMALERSA